MTRATTALAIGFALTIPVAGHAAVTKAVLLACKEPADLLTAAKLRNGGDRKAAGEFEASKKANGSCVEVARNAVVGIDERKPPLVCIRQTGGLDCYWTIMSAIDEFQTKPVAPREPPAPKK